MPSLKQLDYTSQFLKEDQLLPKKDLRFSIKVDEKTPKYLIHKSVCIQTNNIRNRKASSKTRTEVIGGGKKPWKQKGTGRARSGSNTSPLWKGGGVVFGPKPRLYRKKINVKEKHLALTTAIYNARNKIKIINDLVDGVDRPCTRNFLNLISKTIQYDPSKKLTFVVEKLDQNLNLSTRNVPSISLKYPSSITIKDIVRFVISKTRVLCRLDMKLSN